MTIVAKGKFEDGRLKEEDTIVEISLFDHLKYLIEDGRTIDDLIVKYFEEIDRDGCSCSFSESQNHCDCDGYGFTYEYEILEVREECGRCKDCKYYYDEVCCNRDSPLAADFVPENYGCILFERKEKNK
jgi:hypothetical protein